MRLVEVLGGLIALVVAFMKIDLTVLGFTFSLWNVMIYVLVAGLILDLIWRFLDGR